MSVKHLKASYMLSARNWHLPRALPRTEQQRCLPSASAETEPHAAIAVGLQQPLKEFRVESKSETLCAPGKLAGQVFRYVFLGRFYMPICVSPHI